MSVLQRNFKRNEHLLARLDARVFIQTNETTSNANAEWTVRYRSTLGKSIGKVQKIPLFGVIKLIYGTKNILGDAYNTRMLCGDNIRTE